MSLKRLIQQNRNANCVGYCGSATHGPCLEPISSSPPLDNRRMRTFINSMETLSRDYKKLALSRTSSSADCSGPLRKSLKILKADNETFGFDFQRTLREQVRAMQQDDASLREPLLAAQPSGTIVRGQKGWEMDNNLLYYVHEDASRRLVVPSKWRPKVMELAHDIPLAGHLAEEKMRARIEQRFWWPELRKEVKEYCATCPQCQKTQRKPPTGAELIPLPLMDHPFQRIGLDIVGPLLKSQGGHTHILVIIDYATRYPEAVPLRSTTAKVLARELMQVFTRLGFPKEILTDQGTNFMSQTLKELWRLLEVKPIHTAVYHPQSNGLVERFNKTLKGMLRKLVMEKPRRWHLLVAPLMFAIREVPQSSTGFSPFELMYGWNPRGILDLVKERWEEGPDDARITIQQVIEMREHLRTAVGLAKANLGQAQAGQKRRYDQRVKVREFVPGQKVLLLMPSEQAKLFATWQGPYEVTQKIGDVDYEISMPDKTKKKGIFHVNLLKEWKEREALWGDVEEHEFGPEVDSWGRIEGRLPIDETLPAAQQQDLLQVEDEFQHLFSGVPGETRLIQHEIHTPTGVVTRSGNRTWPYHLREAISKEVEEMLQLGIIEPSRSPWRSYPVMVPKADGKMRLCVDFRQLNEVSKFDAYPMPRVDDLLEKLGGSVYLTSLDLTKGYWQIPLREEDKEKTSFVTPRGCSSSKNAIRVAWRRCNVPKINGSSVSPS
ncbi:cytohesin-interacting protein isoform X1 [Pogona vitticeps]